MFLATKCNLPINTLSPKSRMIRHLSVRPNCSKTVRYWSFNMTIWYWIYWHCLTLSDWKIADWLRLIDILLLYWHDTEFSTWHYDTEFIILLNEQWWIYNSYKNRLTCVTQWNVVEPMMRPGLTIAWAFYLYRGTVTKHLSTNIFSTEVYHFIITTYHHKAYK